MKEITTDKTILFENSDTLKNFFKDIDKYKIPSPEEQIQLAREALNGNEKSREKLITSNLRFVITCAKKYQGQGVPLIDLINAGNLGLCMALDKFDPDKGYHFISFAVWYIRREILKELYNTSNTIRYPITFISNITKVKKAYNVFVNKNHKEPTDEELLKLSNLTKKQYKSTVLDKSYCQSFDTPFSSDNTLSMKDIIPDENSSNSLNDVFTKDTIEKSLKVLNDKEYKVITEYYGLCGKPEKSIKEISKEFNVGDERIRQIRKSAIKKLRSRCGKTLKTLL